MTEPIVRCLADVEPEYVKWLWPGRIPLGKLTVLDGDPGLGKSALTLDIAARITTGRHMPDDSTPDIEEPAGVVLLTAEDGLADTIRPRLDAMGADTTRIRAFEGVLDVDGSLTLPMIPHHVDVLADIVRDLGALLVVIDPIMAYFSGSTNSYRDQDVRRALTPISSLADATGASVLVVRHPNKAAGSSPLYRGGGSIGIIGAARSGLLIAKDPDDDDRRILAVTKSNLSKPVPALAFRLEETENGVARVVWDGATDHTAAQLLNMPTDTEERGAMNDAAAFLRDVLAVGPMPAKEVQREARNSGISDMTLRRARSRVGVVTQRSGFGSGGSWMWSLPQRCSSESIDDHFKDVITNDHDDHLWSVDDSNFHRIDASNLVRQSAGPNPMESHGRRTPRCRSCGALISVINDVGLCGRCVQPLRS